MKLTSIIFGSLLIIGSTNSSFAQGKLSGLKDKISKKLNNDGSSGSDQDSLSASEIPTIADSSYAGFLRKAGIVKKDPKLQGGYASSSKDGQYIYAHAYDYRIEVVSFETKDELTTGFVLNMGNSCWDSPVKPNNETHPTHWVAPGTENPIVFYKDYMVVLDKIPTDLASFQVRSWFLFKGSKSKMSSKNEQGQIVPPFSKEALYADMKPFLNASNAAAASAEADKNAAKAAHLAKYSIKGKTITKLEVLTSNFSSLGYGSVFQIGVQATLSDGTVIKTKNLGGEGYLEDYDLKVIGNVTKDYSGDYTVGGNPAVKDDVIKMEVTSKHHAAFAKATNAVAMTYNSNVNLFFDGAYITNSDGRPGETVKIEVRSVSHSSHGDKLVEYKIVRADGSVIIVRLKPENVLKVYSRGADGNYSFDQAKNGGNGGTINVYVDPKVGSNYNLVTDVSGGARGVVPKKEYIQSSPGNEGRVNTIIQALN